MTVTSDCHAPSRAALEAQAAGAFGGADGFAIVEAFVQEASDSH
ncbi:MAG TPA: hypothetical protein VGW34_01135 [Allosphingosinicella sp.]|nr:hypothetical protein [Allosphingosinicella sp.]